MKRAEMEGLLTLLLFYENHRQACINEAKFWLRRAEESQRCRLVDQAFDEQNRAALWQLDAEKWAAHISDIKAKLLEACHD